MLKNKVIIVTGGKGLIGKEIVDDIIRKKGIPVSVDISPSEGETIDYVKTDITDTALIDELIDYVISKYSCIDGLVNCAYPRTSDWGSAFENVSYDSWQKNVDMQLNSTFYISQQVLKHMKGNRNGAIVNISSIYGVVGNDFTLYEDYGGTSAVAYSAIKGGMVNLTRYLASYFGKDNIRVNCVSPGGIKDRKNQHASFIQKYESKVPMKRMGNPDDIAPAVSFLLSDEAKYITGQNLMVDGGWTAI